MTGFRSMAGLAAFIACLGTATPASALAKSDPDGCVGGGYSSDTCAQREGGGVGRGDPNLDPSGMPPGGDAGGQAAADRAEKAAERKRKEAEKRKEDERRRREEEAARPHVKSIGRVSTPSAPAPGPQRTICEAARDARARNSPAAPNLEAQCRASQPRFETRSSLSQRVVTMQAAPASAPLPATPVPMRARKTTLDWGKAAPSSFTSR